MSPKPFPTPSNPKSAGRLFESSSEDTDLADELLIGFEEGVLWPFVQLHPCCCILTLGFTRSKAESASRVARLAKVANNKFKKWGFSKALFFGSVGTFCYDKCIYHSKFNACMHFVLGSSLIQPLN